MEYGVKNGDELASFVEIVCHADSHRIRADPARLLGVIILGLSARMFKACHFPSGTARANL